MSYDFVPNEALRVDSTPITDTPLSMLAWLNPDSVSVTDTIIALGDKDSLNHHHQMRISNGAAQCLSRSGGSSAIATTTETAGTGAWHMFAATYPSTAERNAFLDGSSQTAQETSTRNPSGEDSISLGSDYDASIGTYLDGQGAEFTLWSAEVTAANLDLMAEGVSPLMIQPADLEFHLRGASDELTDVVGNRTMSEIGTPAFSTDHPPTHFATRMLMGMG